MPHVAGGLASAEATWKFRPVLDQGRPGPGSTGLHSRTGGHRTVKRPAQLVLLRPGTRSRPHASLDFRVKV